jgi:hypothetical protein
VPAPHRSFRFPLLRVLFLDFDEKSLQGRDWGTIKGQATIELKVAARPQFTVPDPNALFHVHAP